MIRFILLFCILSFWSCKDEKQISREITGDDLTKDVSTDIHMVYSDSAKTKIILDSPLMENSNKPNDKKAVFPKGLLVTIFDANGQKQSSLKCDYAEQLPRKNLYIFRGNVVWKNGRKDKMETEEMFYDERKKKMYSNKNTFVSFQSQGNTINGYGFEAYDDFTHQKVFNIVNSVIEK